MKKSKNQDSGKSEVYNFKCSDETQIQILYGGIDNDVKIYDIQKRELIWKAKNLQNDKLDLKIPEFDNYI